MDWIEQRGNEGREGCGKEELVTSVKQPIIGAMTRKTQLWTHAQVKNKYVEEYKLGFSLNGKKWSFYKEEGAVKVSGEDRLDRLDLFYQ